MVFIHFDVQLYAFMCNCNFRDIGKMCNVDQHASMIGPPLRPLIRFQLNVASCPTELLA